MFRPFLLSHIETLEIRQYKMLQKIQKNLFLYTLYVSHIAFMFAYSGNIDLCCIFPEKTEVFLEVFGNSEIRKETEEMLKHAAAQLSLSITNTHPCLDTSLLKVQHTFIWYICMYTACHNQTQLSSIHSSVSS